MKKIVGLVFAAALFLSAVSGTWASSSITVYVDGKELKFGVKPIVANGITFVPFRPVFEALGLKVEWSKRQNTITGTDADTRIQLTIGRQTAVVNGVTKKLDAAPAIVNGNTLVPLRFVGEATGSRVVWNGDKRTIAIERPASANQSRMLDGEEKLKTAIGANDLEEIRTLLQAEPALADQLSDVKPIARLAVEQSDSSLLNELMSNTVFDSFAYRDALETAVKAKNVGIVRQLLAVKPKYSSSNDINSDKRMMHLAIDGGRADIVQALLDYQDYASFAANKLGFDFLDYAELNDRKQLKGLFFSYLQTHPAATPGAFERTLGGLKAGLSQSFPYLVTNLGIVPLNYAIEERLIDQQPFDYDIKVEYDDIYLFRTDLDVARLDVLQLLDDERFSELEKKQYIEDLRSFTRNYADYAIKQLNGQFFVFESYIPDGLPPEWLDLVLALDLYESRLDAFLTWANYEPTGVLADYANSSVAAFHFYASGIDSKPIYTDVPMQLLKIGKMPMSINVGDQIQIPLEFIPANATDTDVYYEVKGEHQSIVRVDANGLLTALQPGNAEVWVKAKNSEFLFDLTFVWVR